MLVREVFSEIRIGEDGRPYTFTGERFVEMPDVRTEAEQDAINAAEAQAAAVIAGNETTIKTAAEAALVDLRAYRDLATPSNAQTVAAVKLLCRVCIGLIRLAIRKLDGTS